MYSLYNEASNVALVPAQNLIVLTNAVEGYSGGTQVDSNFTTAFTSASSLTTTNVTEIATDIAAPANTSALELGACVSGFLTAESLPANQTNIQTGTAYCQATPSAMATATTEFTGSVQPGVASAAAAWPQLSQLVGFLGSASGVMQSADSASVSSSGTVVSTTDPFAYDIKLSAPSGGYIVPSAFSLTFPAGLSVNTELVADEVNAAANGTTPSDIAAIEASPSGTSIGTVTLTSPLADEFGGSNNQFVGKIYVVTTGASSGQGSATQPYLELWFTSGIYDIGSFPNSLAFPLTLNFGEATVAGLGQEPLPINSLELNFPAATSPAKTSSCTTLGTAGGTATDEIAGLAYEFGDKNDGVSSATATPAAVTLTATPTAVTNQCTATVTKVTNTLSASMGGLTGGTPTLSLKVGTTGTAFGTVTVGLPSGLKFAKSTAKKLAKEVSGSKIKSVKISGGKLVITLKSKVKSETIKTKKGLINESAALIKKIKKHKTKKLNLSVKAGTFTVKASVKA